MFGFFSPKPRVANLADYAVRPYTPADHKAVLAVIESRFDEIGTRLDLEGADKDLSDIQKYWREEGGDFMVLTHAEKVVGCICAKPRPERPRAAEVDWFFWDKNYEGKGLSLMLLKWCMGWCQRKGIITVELWSSEKRTRTHKLYRKLGFVHNGIKRQYRDNPPQFVLFFELDASNPQTLTKLDKLFAHI